MAEAKTLERIKERRLDRMRLGQGACEIVSLPSDPEIRFALVPLTESEYDRCQQLLLKSGIEINNPGSADVLDRMLTRYILMFSIREVDNLANRIFEDEVQLLDTLDQTDVNFLRDEYTMMADKSSPSIDGLTEKEIEELKKALSAMDWSALSGKQWWLLKRFLSTLTPLQLQAS